MPPETTPATTAPVAGTITAKKVSLLSKVETFFEDVGKDAVVDFDALEADIKAAFAKHAKPVPAAPTAAPAAPAAASTPPATPAAPASPSATA